MVLTLGTVSILVVTATRLSQGCHVAMHFTR